MARNVWLYLRRHLRRRCSSRCRRCRRRLALGVMCRRRRGRVYPTTLQLAQGSVGILQFLIRPEFTSARTVPVQCPDSARMVFTIVPVHLYY